MSALRARHWLAAIFALGLLVVVYRSDNTVDLDGGLAEALAVEEEPESLPLAERSAPEPADDNDPADPVEDDANRQADGPAAPLTGLATDRATAERSALVIKVDNHPRARPQTGLELADIVFDYRAEGITRFAAVFQSQIPDPVGPVRSSRTSDFDLLRGLDTPIYGSSGGNDYVTNGLRNLPIVELTNRTRNEYFRNFSRPAPHNLYVNGSDLYALAPDDLPTPEPWFRYRPEGASLPPTASPAVGPISVAFTDSPLVTHEWDAGLGGWRRTQDGAPHTTVDGDQLAPENVVIFVTDYRTSPADASSPEVRSTGGGPLVVLTAGNIITGRWERPTAEDKPIMTDGRGEVISLTPGRTWVLLPEQGQVRFADGQSLDGPSGSASAAE